MSSPYYFEFIGSVWEQLSSEDRDRIAELWQGYEQTLAAFYQKYVELDLNLAVSDMLPYTCERWLPYSFTSANFIQRAATITSTQDMSAGLNLSNKYLLKFRIDGVQTFEVNVQGALPDTTTINEIISKINLSAAFPFATSLFQNSILHLASRTIGVNSSIEVLETSIPTANACEFVLGITQQDLPLTFPKYRYPYTLPYERIASIPTFQDHVREENVSFTIHENVDYAIESGNIISFKDIPPESLRAVTTYIDEENPWYNYGYLTEIYQKNSPRYVGVIQGLWFAFWNGPKPSNVRISLYLLFGLPTAPADGVITAVSPTSITFQAATGEVTVFEVPAGLNPEVSAGQSVVKFTPLVDGIEVYDKINYPNFLEAETGRIGIQRFLTEDASRGIGTEENPTDEDIAMKTLQEYTFLPQISVDAFIYPDINLKNVRVFLDNFKPLNKTYLFQVIVGTFRDLLGLQDKIGANIDIDLTSNLDSNETTFLDSPTLDSYEGSDIPALNLDPHGILFEETLAVEVWQGMPGTGTLLDSFTA